MTREIGAINDKRKKLEATIMQELKKDKKLLKTAYNEAISEMGDFIKNHIRKEHKGGGRQTARTRKNR